MFTKRSLKEKFSSEWKRHYHVEIFAERGFQRRKCKVCNEYFWSLKEKETCGCEKYEFIGNPVTKKKTDYIETWKIFENFFAKHDHTPINRYPVIDRWRPDLFFTMASIQDFQRIDQGNMVFEYPAENLIVPQVCLRFNDIPNVGVTGRHHTSFIMSGQHSFGGYWKDRCIELNFKFLTEAMGIPEEEIVYKEDVWAMPDFSAFGPCIETFCLGLELANSVFMQFTKTGNTYKELPLKVIDVGWGHERLVWFSQGTPTGYDAVFGPVIKWMKKQSGLKENDLFRKYAALAGNMDIDEVHDIDKARLRIAKTLGVSLKELKEIVEPFQALYAIADHTKTLLFAITDAGIPSNTGGGYNLRVILRRALSFLKEFEFPFSLEKIAELHAKYLYPLFPELSENLNLFSKIIEVEKEQKIMELKDIEEIVKEVANEEKRKGRNPYIAPIGGSLIEGSMHIPFGAIAYMEAFLELYEQALTEKVKIDSIIVATGSGSTQAGLLVGATLISPETKIVGISVSEDKETMKRYVKTIGDRTFSEIGIKEELNYENIIVFDEYLKEGYGILNKEVTEAIGFLAREEGILLDPVYTGKAMAGMIDLIKKGYFKEGENIVFLHTGGTPALFPYREQIISFLKEKK